MSASTDPPVLAPADLGNRSVASPTGPTPDRTALRAAASAATGLTFGAQGVSASPDTGSAGAVGEATATSGEASGVLGRVASPAGTAGVFESTGGGPILRGISEGTVVFEVTADGTVIVTDLYGAGTGLGALGDLECTFPCLVGDAVLEEDGLGHQDLAAGAVGSAEIQTGGVGTADIAFHAVAGAALADLAVTSPAIADGSVASADISANALTDSEIANGAVTHAKLAAETLRRGDIDGIEVPIYEVDADCSGAHLLTFATQCTTRSCGLALFLTCSGGCSAGSPQVCANSLYGYLLDPDIEEF